MKTNYVTLSVFILMFISSDLLLSQQKYTLSQSVSSISIKGTSSLHDWTMEVHELICNSVVEIANTSLNKLDEVSFSCKVAKIVSNESSLMDSKAHDALKGDKFPVITFNSKEITGLKIVGDQFSGNLSGLLTIAGKSKIESLPFLGKVVNANQWNVKGSIKIKMSDFNIAPPTAMLGTLKTGDEINLIYAFNFNKALK